ncbi:outer plastid envelope protein 16-1 [Actinidia rufa]|uniref:Outer plastid envelope protein 16-1 n=1 Tax=Actinidia rufa TaxID=165716 RepID=A0A7J0GR25_9ERIC|nr:outer plastid envelope protein 16-1 [Actinidia rufa]
MPGTGFRGTLTSPKVDLMVDMGHPFLNLTVDGFLKIGTLKKMCKEGVYWGKYQSHLELLYLISDTVSRRSVKQFFCDYWYDLSETQGIALRNLFITWAGTIAGVYVGMEYGAERICGTRNWKTAMIGGALTGALVSAATKNNRDKIVMDAITGGAVATAAKFLNYLT